MLVSKVQVSKKNTVKLYVADRLEPEDIPAHLERLLGDTVLVYRCIDWQAPLLLPPFFEAGRWHYGHSRWQWVERTVSGIVWEPCANSWKLRFADDDLGAYCGDGAGLQAGYKLPQTSKQLAAA